jgi:hypothetical protein
VIEARRRACLDEVPRRHRHVIDVARRDDAIGEHLHLASLPQAVDDVIERAAAAGPSRRRPKQALDAQHVRAGPGTREPFAQQLGRCIDAARGWPEVFSMRLVPFTIEDEISAVVNQHRASRFGGPGKTAYGEGVDRQRLDRPAFGAVDIVEGRAVDDEMRRRTGNSPGHGIWIGHIE